MGTTPSIGAMTTHANSLMGEFTFPWAFPKAGRYMVWEQFRVAGAIRTAAFEVRVSEATYSR
jgi:hypothetical protein